MINNADNLMNNELSEESSLSDEKYNSLYNLDSIPYFILSTDGVIKNVNLPGAQFLKIRKENLINRFFLRYIFPESQNKYLEFQKKIISSSGIVTSKIKMIQRSGTILYVKLKGKLIKNPICKSNKLLIIIIKELEPIKKYEFPEISRSSVNLQNDISFILANEINHPLAVIGNYLHGSLNRLQKNDYVKSDFIDCLNKSIQQLERATNIILKMQNFIYYEKLEYKLICLDSLIQSTLEIIKMELFDYPVEIIYKNIKNLPKIKIDDSHIQQVILNLARNAIEAMRDANIDNPRLIIEINRFKTNFIEISVLDNGLGYTANIAHRIFEANFTTKSYAVGLGLSFCKKLIEAHGGAIRSELNRMGSCFTVSLPIE